MKNKEVKEKVHMPLNLQFFAEPGSGDGGGEPGNGGGADPGGGEPGNGGGADPGGENLLSFDDFMKEENNKKEFEKRISAAIEAEKAKWKKDTDSKLSEAEKLSQMTESEKAEYLSEKRTKELDAREEEITRKELMAEAKNTLAGKKLPVTLAEVLSYKDADSCKKSIEVVENAFREALEAAVQERLKGGDPLKKAPDGKTDTQYDEILGLMSE